MTEENKDLAGRFARFCAAMIDGVILMVLLFAIAKITGFWEQIMPRLAQNIPLTMEESIIAFVVGQALVSDSKWNAFSETWSNHW